MNYPTVETVKLLALGVADMPGRLLEEPEEDHLRLRGMYNASILAGLEPDVAVQRALEQCNRAHRTEANWQKARESGAASSSSNG